MQKQLRIKEQDLKQTGEDADGSPIYSYNNKPFTGICLTYNKEGWLEAEEEFYRGHLNGTVRNYFKGGQLKSEYSIQEGEIQPGTYKEYDGAGKLKLEF